MAILVAPALLSPYPPLLPHSGPAYAQTEGRLYKETGKTLAAQFLPFYDKSGGLAVLGYPVTEARPENGYLVQWTERQRLEYHPEHRGTPYEVLLGLLGHELTDGYNGPRFQAQAQAGVNGAGQAAFGSGALPAEGAYYFKETGQLVPQLFYSYWSAHGGLPVFGYPISSLYTDETGLQVQWFERARFERHPENLGTSSEVLLGRLGLEALQEADSDLYRLQVHNTPAPESALQIGLAQGGESSDPDFFSNIRGLGRDLGPGLVRLDNIFNYYGIVQRGADGKISYTWDRFDRVLDGVLAMGKQPFLCLSYMPETMTASGSSRVMPPADYEEWAALVEATVLHVNRDRKIGVRYWEVWNEPNQSSFWQSSYEEYLRLYDVTVQAVLRADPAALIGGPAISSFSQDSLSEFLQHEAQLGSVGRVDFLSWHSYGQSAAELASDIRRVRGIAALFPFNPELIISEFNVLQGGPGDTSARSATDTTEGAIAFLSSIESMQRERLDKALLFELKDGAGPKSYWGRWGMLTNDGLPKPIYYAYRAYQSRPDGQLPVSLRAGGEDGTVGLLAYGSPRKSTLILWYKGAEPARVKLALPPEFGSADFDVALFDANNNNPARSGDPALHTLPARNAGDLMFNLRPQSLVILSSR